MIANFYSNNVVYVAYNDCTYDFSMYCYCIYYVWLGCTITTLTSRNLTTLSFTASTIFVVSQIIIGVGCQAVEHKISHPSTVNTIVLYILLTLAYVTFRDYYFRLVFSQVLIVRLSNNIFQLVLVLLIIFSLFLVFLFFCRVHGNLTMARQRVKIEQQSFFSTSGKCTKHNLIFSYCVMQKTVF